MSGSKQLVVGFWNNHGIQNKIESPVVQNWITKHDIIFLCETKTSTNFSVPDFRVVSGKTTNPNRGGVVFLIKNYLSERVTKVDISMDNQIWFELSDIPNVLFGGCYVAPSDSAYFSDQR